ncbi:YcxB family protein [Anaeromicrobium sediminis]|uniref:YcxB-like C-terminal domain-containing protein n=1 Tax=Anaeromicrobium sediminis TaxID=1478221 RepID=A0A267MNI1_9FIRM|nr:YcxB family protein [Anaeromicrobium sediminis]PAB61154.1 hypothetical protein CCE28_01645 [Anaeromicrobium sediminis]
MKITYSITKEDFWNFNKFISHQTTEGKRNKMFSNILILISAGVFFHFTKLVDINDSILLTIAWILGLSIANYITRYPMAKRRAFKFAKTEKGILDEQTIEIKLEGISKVTHSSNNFYKWTAISRIDMIDEYIFVFLNKRKGIVIPKRVFKSENEAIQFYNTAIGYFKSS